MKKIFKYKYFIIISSITLIIVSVSILFIKIYTAHRTPQKSSYTINRHIQYSFTLQNETNHLIKNAELWVFAPVKKTATQKCEKIVASYPYKIIDDDLGNQILYFTFTNLPPYSSKIVSVKTDILLSGKENPVDIKDQKIFLNPEKYVESDDKEILSLANTLKGKNQIEIAQKAFEWVSGNIKYSGYLKEDRGAKYALSTKSGDCTEFMHLFLAICRANNVSSRGIGGFVCKDNAILKPAQYHNWAEFYDGRLWKMADPQNKIFAKNISNYIAMRIISSNYPVSGFNKFKYHGEGLKVRMNS